MQTNCDTNTTMYASQAMFHDPFGNELDEVERQELFMDMIDNLRL